MAGFLPVRFTGPLPFVLGGARLDLSHRVLVMGIVNRTPDSFYDRGRYFALDDALQLADELRESGADMIDVGGVRAGPGPEVSVGEEIDRVVPVVEAITSEIGIPVSVDTWRAEVAETAFAAGAVVGNDISGFADAAYLDAAARHGASVVATHIRIGPRIDDPTPEYPDDDVVRAVESYLLERLEMAAAAGISSERVCFDAGLDLGKTTEQSLALLGASARLSSHGPALLLSASNKGFLGELLDRSIGERHDATTAALALGVSLGCRILRVHDARAAVRVARTLEAVLN